MGRADSWAAPRFPPRRGALDGVVFNEGEIEVLFDGLLENLAEPELDGPGLGELKNRQ